MTLFVPPQYQLALPQLTVEGRPLALHRGTGVSVMIALAYLHCWDPDAVVVIYPPEHGGGRKGPRVERVDAALAAAARSLVQVILLALPWSDGDGEPPSSIVCARVSVLWALAHAAQPALMELLEAFALLIDLDAEAPALALLYDRVPSIDFSRDILGACPGALVPMAIDRADAWM